jgi:phage pi2 protein 07
MKLIALRGKRGKGKYTLVDDSDYKQLINYNWYMTSHGYVATDIKTKRTYRQKRLHRILLQPSKGKVIDHINGNPLDNQRSNLRICTTSQNIMNQRISRNNTSGFKGVSKTKHRWIAEIYKNNKRHRIASFQDKHIAALAYDLWAIDLHGEYAKTNFTVVSHSKRPI